jgi:hypothetical protein
VATTSNPQSHTDERPRNWRWDEDGDDVAGRFLGWSVGRTQNYGPKKILILDVDGEPRSVWLFATALENKLKDEVFARPNADLNPGERIVIRRGQMVTGKVTGNEYRDFDVSFPDRPPVTAGQLWFGDSAGAEVNGNGSREPDRPASTAADPAHDDDIPF